MKEIIWWTEKDSMAMEDSYNYWNDEQVEKKKKFHLTGLERERKEFMEYLVKSGLLSDFNHAVKLAYKDRLLKGKVLDAASGTCWTSALLSRVFDVEQVDALDFSWHRLNDIAPHVFEALDAETDKINRIAGSFYQIKREGSYYDTVFLSQAFHHASHPDRLLEEVSRVLKPGGAVIVTGETVITRLRYFKRVIGKLLKDRMLCFDFWKLFPPDKITGDHRYRINDYLQMYNKHGFEIVSWSIPVLRENGSFIAMKTGCVAK